MTNNKPNLNIPVMFQKGRTFETEDTRFISVKIWLMHLGENLNGSYFEKSVVESALSSLANTPILAYIEKNSDNEDDFSDHREVLVKEDGKYKTKYIGEAIGVIPESNNAKFEFRLCDDGLEREFLTVDGLVWQNKWDDAPDILSRDKNKAQSMEIHDDYTGQFEEDNLFHFKSFKFYGACGLGKNVSPAMHNASIEVNFSFEDFKSEIQNKMEQFKQFSLQNHLSKYEDDNINQSIKQEGGKEKVDEKLEILKKFNLTVEEISFNIEEVSLEDLESKINEHFSLSNSQLMVEINKVLETMTEMSENYWGEIKERRIFYLMDLKDEHAIVVNNNWDTYYGIPYVVNGDVVTLNAEEKVEYIPDWRPKQTGDNPLFTNINDVVKSDIVSLKEDFESKINDITEKFENTQIEKSNLETQLVEANEKYSLVEPELTRLKEFESTKLTEERNSNEEILFSQYEDELKGISDYETLKASSKNYSLQDLEKECALLFVKKTANFSLNRNNTTIKIPVPHKENKEYKPYGDLIKE